MDADEAMDVDAPNNYLVDLYLSDPETGAHHLMASAGDPAPPSTSVPQLPELKHHQIFPRVLKVEKENPVTHTRSKSSTCAFIYGGKLSSVTDLLVVKNATGAKVPGASADVAKVYLKVDWKEKVPPKWTVHLEKALQSWGNETKTCSFQNVKRLNDGTRVEVEITPSSALSKLKEIRGAELNFKGLNKEKIQVHFLMDEPKSVHRAPASGRRVDEKTLQIPNQVGITSMADLQQSLPEAETEFMKPGTSHVGNHLPVTGHFDSINNSYREVQEAAGAKATSPGPSVNSFRKLQEVQEAAGASNTGAEPMKNNFSVPLLHFWYLSQTYRQELEQIQNEFGVNIEAEVSVTILSKENTQSDSVNKATQSFSNLFLEAANNMKSVSIPQMQLESDIMKEVIKNIPNPQDRMVLSRSADSCCLFAPVRITAMVENHLQLQTPKTMKLDMKGHQDPLEMDPSFWDLTRNAYKSQISELESKYGVTFFANPGQGSILVEARSKGSHQVKLETHALRALMNIYQKVSMSAVSCALKDPSIAVSQVFHEIRHRHPAVGARETNGEWKLIGLPHHLVPAIADIEGWIGRPVFDDKIKRILSPPKDHPRASGSQRGEVMGSSNNASMKDRTEVNGKKKESEKDEEDLCCICLDTLNQKMKLNCGHEFCRECLKSSEKSLGKICPLCKKVYGKLIGTQPRGSMDVVHQHHSKLPGFPKCGIIEIRYHIPSGTQTDQHPNPGRAYSGTTRTAYLPDNTEGKEVLELLRRAFDQRLIFTVGTSTTSGREDSVTWNDIHHKTSVHGGAGNFGYPDPDYLKRVKEELKAKGIE